MFVRYPEPRRIAEYVGQPGPEIGGLLLSPVAYQVLAESKTSGRTCELVVIGEDRIRNRDGSAGDRYLVYGVPTEYIASVTDYRWDATARKLRLICPGCDLRDGRHTRTCPA